MSRCTICYKPKTTPFYKNGGRCSDCLILLQLDWQSLGEYWIEAKPKMVYKKKYFSLYKGKKRYLTEKETAKQRVYMRKRKQDSKICLYAKIAIKNCLGQNRTLKEQDRLKLMGLHISVAELMFSSVSIALLTRSRAQREKLRHIRSSTIQTMNESG